MNSFSRANLENDAHAENNVLADFSPCIYLKLRTVPLDHVVQGATMTPETPAFPLSKKLLDVLACPVCKTGLAVQGSATLRCNTCSRIYPIRDGIPILLEQESTRETL